MSNHFLANLGSDYLLKWPQINKKADNKQYIVEISCVIILSNFQYFSPLNLIVNIPTQNLISYTVTAIMQDNHHSQLELGLPVVIYKHGNLLLSVHCMYP